MSQTRVGPTLKVSMLAVLVSITVISFGARSATFEAECPEEIKTTQTPVKMAAQGPAAKGWQTHVDTVNARQIFTGLVMFDGLPKDNTQLFPEEAAAAAGAPTGAATSDVVYKIPAGREVHMACEYTNTLVRFTKKLPSGLATCRVRFSATLGHVQKVVCD